MMTTDTQTKPDEPEVEVVEESTALKVAEVAQIAHLVEIAKRHPRSVDLAIAEATTLATLDEETAGSMFYNLPQKGKSVEGPSVRLAEIMSFAWTNMSSDASVISVGRTHLVAEGVCVDIERLNRWRVTVTRRITDKHGRRYSDDMIGKTSNAAISIALRNAVFRAIPQALVRPIFLKARKASIGQANTHTQKRQLALETFSKMGISNEQLFGLIDIHGINDIGEDQLIQLRGMLTALKDGETTVEGLLSRNGDSSAGVDDLNAAVAAKKEEAPPEPGEPQTDEIGKLSREKLLTFIKAELLTTFPKDGNDVRKGYMVYLEQCVEDGLLDNIDLSSKKNSKEQLVKMLVAVRGRNSGGQE